MRSAKKKIKSRHQRDELFMLTSRVVRKSSLVQLGLPSRTEAGQQEDTGYEEPDAPEAHADKENQASQSHPPDLLELRLNGAANHAHSVRPYRCADQKPEKRDAPALSLSEKPRSMNSASHLLLPSQCHPHPPFCGVHVSSTTAGFPTHEQAPLVCAPGDPIRVKFATAASGPVAVGTKPASGRHTEEQCQQPAAAVPNPTALNSADESLVKFIIGGVERYFRKVAQIGRGGSSKVFKIVSVDDYKVYALKEVYTKGVDSAVKKAYINEIQLLKNLKGQQEIITLYECMWNKEEGTLSLLLEYAESDLAAVIKKQCGALCKNPFAYLYYWHEMLQVVKVIHDAGVIHNDLKPENFVLVGGKLKIIDFGIANKIETNATSIQKDLYSGTLNYMSPEAVQTNEDNDFFKVGKPSDIWSLGCILHFMVQGKSPFEHITNKIKKLQVIVDPNEHIQLPTMNNVNKPAIPLIKMCLHRNPKERPTVDHLLSICSSFEQMMSLTV